MVFCILYFSISDPHIRVIGRAENVKVAREKILASLDTRVRT